MSDTKGKGGIWRECVVYLITNEWKNGRNAWIKWTKHERNQEQQLRSQLPSYSTVLTVTHR